MPSDLQPLQPWPDYLQASWLRCAHQTSATLWHPPHSAKGQTLQSLRQRKRDLLTDGLRRIGFRVSVPEAGYFTVADAGPLGESDARALAGSLHNDLQAAALDLRPELADVIAVAEEAGALRAIVSGSGPTIAALVEDPGSAQRVSRALKASGLVAEVLRADAPVAGARVVG